MAGRDEFERRVDEAMQTAATTGILDLRRCRLTEVPAAAFQLEGLTELYLSGTREQDWGMSSDSNRLTRLPAALGNLTSLEVLDVRDNKLTSLPEWLGNLTSLTTLAVSSNNLTSLPEWLGNLTSLASLDVSWTKLTSLPEWLGNLTSLTSLDVRGNELTILPEWLGNLTSLTTLAVSSNNLTSLPEWLGNLTSLTSLDVRGNELTILPEWLGNLTSLTSLDVRGNELTSLPEWLGNLTSLTSLDVRRNNLTSLPEWLGNLTSLTTLAVSSNNLTSLPESLGNLTSLTSLDVRRNELTILPESLGNLTSLTSLDVRRNELTILPESLGNLTSLTSLDVSSNNLTILPESLGNLTSLTSLAVYSNNLTILPEWLGNLTSLTSLAVYSNELTILPEWLGNLTSLTSLDVSSNNLTSLPEWLGNLTSLTSLAVYSNELTILPEWLGNLTSLTSLAVYSNELTILPEWLGNLTSLTSLDVSSNNLTSLPESLGNLTSLTSLYVSSNNLTSLPEWLGNLTSLTSLAVYSNNLTSLPESLGNLTSLTTLNVSSNNLTILPESLGNLTSLTSLYVSSNNLTILPESLGNLTSLTSLAVYSNNLTILPEWLGNLTSLTSLAVYSNELTSLPEWLGNLTSLTSLAVYSNELTILPEWLGNLTSLTSLDVSSNNLTSLPESLGNLTSLTSLYVSSNNLTSLPEWLGNLTSLTSLAVYSNNLTSLPESLGNLTSLTTLNVSSNNLTILPESLGNLTSLTSLYVSSNNLTILPESLGNLTSLTSLYVSNKLTILPESLGNLTSLTSLDVSSNNLTSLPESLGNLTSLTSLDVSSNNLTSLPEWLGNLTSLTTLNVSDNQLTILPESLGNLTSLTTLDIRSNKLTILPESLGNLTSLTTLDIRSNKLTILPESLGNLISLTTLDIRFNPAMTRLPDCVFQLPNLQTLYTTNMIWPPRSILTAAERRGAAVLRPFWEALQRDAQPLSRARVVFCGDGGVGKTTLKMALQMESPDTHHTNEAVVLQWARALLTAIQGWPHPALRHWIVHDLGCKKPPDGVSDMTGRDWLELTDADLRDLFRGFPRAISKMKAARLVLRFASGALTYDAMVRQLVRAEEGQPPPPYAALLAVPHVWTEAVELSEWRVAEDRTVSLLDFPGQVQFFPSSEMFLWSLGAVYLAVYDARKTTDANIAHLSEWLGLLCSGMPEVIEEQYRPTVILVATHSGIAVVEPTAPKRLLSHLSRRPFFKARVAFHPEIFRTLYHEPDGGGLHELRALLADLTSKSTDLLLPYTTHRSILSILHDPDRPHIKAWPIVAANDPAIDYDGQERHMVLGVLEDIGVIKQLDRGARILIKPFDWLNRMTSAVLRGVDPSVRLYGAAPANVPLVTATMLMELLEQCSMEADEDHAAAVLLVLGQFRVCFEWAAGPGRWCIPALLPVISPKGLGGLPILQLGAVFIGRRYTLSPGSSAPRLPPSFAVALLNNVQRLAVADAVRGTVLLLRRGFIVLDLDPVRLRVAVDTHGLGTVVDVIASGSDDPVALKLALHVGSLAVASAASASRQVHLMKMEIVRRPHVVASPPVLPLADGHFKLQPCPTRLSAEHSAWRIERDGLSEVAQQLDSFCSYSRLGRRWDLLTECAAIGVVEENRREALRAGTEKVFRLKTGKDLERAVRTELRKGEAAFFHALETIDYDFFADRVYGWAEEKAANRTVEALRGITQRVTLAGGRAPVDLPALAAALPALFNSLERRTSAL